MTEVDALQEQDDTHGHRFGGEIGEAPVEVVAARWRPGTRTT
jgi:hypothetical protein